jgi:hypothetical protein
LADHFAGSPGADREPEHREVGSDVTTGERLADDVRAFEMSPRRRTIAAAKRFASRAPLFGPCGGEAVGG